MSIGEKDIWALAEEQRAAQEADKFVNDARFKESDLEEGSQLVAVANDLLGEGNKRQTSDEAMDHIDKLTGLVAEGKASIVGVANFIDRYGKGPEV